MWFRKRSSWIALALGLAGMLATAEEALPPEKAEKKEEKVSRETIEFYKKESRINALKGRIDESNVRFHQLVEEKNGTHDPLIKQAKAQEMAALAKERNDWVREYNSLRIEVKYKYPSKGEVVERRYLPMKERSVEEMEQTSDVDEKLTRLHKQVEKKYAPFKPKEEANAELAPKAKTAREKPERLKLVK